MRAHIACRQSTETHDETAGCFLVCSEHGVRQSYGFAHRAAHAACVEHNLALHA